MTEQQDEEFREDIMDYIDPNVLYKLEMDNLGPGQGMSPLT